MSSRTKLFSVKHYVAVLRRQSAHTQHIVALLFAGLITGSIGAVILYYDYGFWRDTYNKRDDAVVEDEMVTVQSPGEMFSTFVEEAAHKLNSVNHDTKSLLEGKDTYTSTP